MSVPVAPDQLASTVDARRGSPFLITVGPDGRPKVSSVLVVVDDVGPTLTIWVGDRTRANVAERPDVTVLWPHADGEEHALIVDGEAKVVEGAVVVSPTWAVLHVPAGRRGS